MQNFQKMTHHETLSDVLVYYIQVLSLNCPSDIYTSVSEDDSASEYSSDSDNVNNRPTKRQKTLKIDSELESENETLGVENAPLPLQKSGLKTTFHEN